MAKAKPKGSTLDDEIWLIEAVDLLAGPLGGSAEFAQRLLVKGLGAGHVPWSGLLDDGTRYRDDGAFWRGIFLDVAWSKNQACQADLIAPASGGTDPSEPPAVVHAIKVSRRAALALLPPAVRPSATPAPAKRTRSNPQRDRVLRVLAKLFPPEGQVPVGMAVETVRGMVAEELALESRQLGKADPSADTVGKAIHRLGRRGD